MRSIVEQGIACINIYVKHDEFLFWNWHTFEELSALTIPMDESAWLYTHIIIFCINRIGVNVHLR